MQRMPHFLMAGLLIASLAIAVFGGNGALWLLPLVVWPIVIAYAIWDRRQQRREGRAERLAAR